MNVEVLKQAAEKGGQTAVMGSGLFSLINYLFQPVTLVIVYFLIEGAARAAAGIVSGEILPTMPLALLDLGHEKKKKIDAEAALGPRVPDEVIELIGAAKKDAADELRICSCREKVGWDHLMTITYNDKLYEVARQEHGEPPRPHIYVLRKKPDWKVVRGMHHYEPDEIMKTD